VSSDHPHIECRSHSNFGKLCSLDPQKDSSCMSTAATERQFIINKIWFIKYCLILIIGFTSTHPWAKWLDKKMNKSTSRNLCGCKWLTRDEETNPILFPPEEQKIRTQRQRSRDNWELVDFRKFPSKKFSNMMMMMMIGMYLTTGKDWWWWVCLRNI